MIRLAALRTHAASKALHYLGVVLGVAGILTLAPPLGELAAVFGLGLIVWFAWMGTRMLRESGARGVSVDFLRLHGSRRDESRL